MTQLKNAKVLPKGDKLFLIDAPEEPEYKIYGEENPHELAAYQEALSKAPTWEIKNEEEVVKLLTEKEWPFDWQPEQGKLYDIPTGYTYKFLCCDGSSKIETCERDCDAYNSFHKQDGKFAILIPQEEVKKEQIIIDGGLHGDAPITIKMNIPKDIDNTEIDNQTAKVLAYQKIREEVKGESQDKLLEELFTLYLDGKWTDIKERFMLTRR